MFASKALHRKIIENSFKETSDGKFIFFPRLGPKVFRAYVVPDEETKEHILKQFEERRKFEDVLGFILVISGAILGVEIGYLFAFLLVAVPWLVMHLYWRKKIGNIFSVLEVYEGPDSLPPLY